LLPCPRRPPIATLAALAAHTRTLRFSPLVVNAGLWRPDLLVREFMTADQISDGRVDIGLGAGVAPGGPTKPLTHLRSAVDAILASLDDAANPPGWVSTPSILIAGSGDKLLRFAGERRDAVGIAGPFPTPGSLSPGRIPLLSPAAADDRIAAIRAGAGDRFDQIDLNVGAEVHITTDRHTAAEQAHQAHSYLSVDEILASPKFLAGTTDEIAEQLRGHRERFGLNYFATIGIPPAEFAPVIHALR
jgi:alkanesulfonate monooxygenase SsuD/methylene tetrahydromethanopterin reductase-like flavin-dependent oxidoreductase (luciferase family)